MEVTTCYYCHKLVYVGFLDRNRFLFDDPTLEHPHTKTKCQQGQNNNKLENIVQEIRTHVIELRSEIIRIKEKIGLD